MENAVEKIKSILKNKLPKGSYINVHEGKLMGEPYIKIFFAASNININGVDEQKPEAVSLILHTKTLELHPQVFGGNGGQCIYRKPNMEDGRERYLAMKNVKIPFKRPKAEEKFVLSAIERFAENWLNTLRENKEVLMYNDLVNYDEYLK